jgi:hypothetical protein
MVKRIEKENISFYLCEECGLAYKEKVWAEKCEKFCSEHHACSVEISSHAIQVDALDYSKLVNERRRGFES